MRLAIVGPVHPLRGGIALHGIRLAAAARDRGHEVTVFSFRRLYPGLFFPGKSELDSGPPVTSLEGIAIARRLDALRPWTWSATAAVLRVLRADVVLLQRWHPFFAPALATIAASARRTGSRVVWLVHNACPHEHSRLPWGPLLTLGMRDEDRILTHARTEVSALAALGVRAPARVVPMPAPERAAVLDREAARRELGIAPPELVLLFLGYVRTYKGVDVLLDALSRLASGGRPWRALVVGEWYIAREPLEELRRSAEHGAGRVEIVDRYVSEFEVSRFLAACDAVVLPYRSGTQSAVIPLAYEHGRGVVTTMVGGLADAVEEGKTGLLVPPSDPEALAVALEQLRSGRQFDAVAIRRAAEGNRFSKLVEALESVALTAPGARAESEPSDGDPALEFPSRRS